jgi:hypothetical protein
MLLDPLEIACEKSAPFIAAGITCAPFGAFNTASDVGNGDVYAAGRTAMDTVSRRVFLTAGTLLLSARSYARIVGANDRIQIGLIGCGHRSAGHRQMLKMSAETDPNFDLRSVCDLWSVNRERAAADAQRLFGKRPRTFQYSEEMLADPAGVESSSPTSADRCSGDRCARTA